jgi:hypothetical protein
MRTPAPISFDQSQEQVEGMMQQGTAFTRVEDAIDASELSGQHKAALWLLAWSLRDHALQRQDARLMVAAVGAATERVVDAIGDSAAFGAPEISHGERRDSNQRPQPAGMRSSWVSWPVFRGSQFV